MDAQQSRSGSSGAGRDLEAEFRVKAGLARMLKGGVIMGELSNATDARETPYCIHYAHLRAFLASKCAVYCDFCQDSLEAKCGRKLHLRLEQTAGNRWLSRR
jgi:hypothetical protein